MGEGGRNHLPRVFLLGNEAALRNIRGGDREGEGEGKGGRKDRGTGEGSLAEREKQPRRLPGGPIAGRGGGGGGCFCIFGRSSSLKHERGMERIGRL